MSEEKRLSSTDSGAGVQHSEAPGGVMTAEKGHAATEEYVHANAHALACHYGN